MTSTERRSLVVHRLHRRQGLAAPGAKVGAYDTSSFLLDAMWIGFPVFMGSYMYFGHHASAMASVGWGFASLLGVAIGTFLLGFPGMIAGGGLAAYLALTSPKKASS